MIPAIHEALKGAAAVPGLGNMFSEEGVKHLVTQSGLVLPEEGVTKGKTWEQKVEMKSPVGKILRRLLVAGEYEEVEAKA